MSKRPPARPRKRATKSPEAIRKAERPTRGGRGVGKRVRTARARAAAGALALPAECTLAGAESLKLELASLLRSEKPVTLDVSGVRRIDTASLQLLAAFARDRRAVSLAVEVHGDSPAFAEGARLLGLARLFDMTPAARPA